MPLTNPVPGPPAAVLAAVLRGGAASGQRNQATFSTSNYPDLPSLITDVVALSVNATLDADISVTGVLVSQGWATQGVVSVTTTYGPVAPNIAVVLCNATTGAFTVTLPDATQPGYVTGQRYTVIKTDAVANNVTVAASAGQLIAGSATSVLTAASAYISVVFDGANWQIWSSSSTGSSPIGAAGGVLSGTYPNPGFAITASFSGSKPTNSIVAVANTATAPTLPVLGLTAAAAGDLTFGLLVTGDTSQRFSSDSTGVLKWGPGNATQDVQLSRSSANVLQVTSPSSATAQLLVTGSNATTNALLVTNTATSPSASIALLQAASAGDNTLGIRVSGDSSVRFKSDSTGKFQWGPGNATQDTDLYRSGAGALTTDGAFVVSSGLTVVGGVNGALAAISVAPSGATAETFPRVFANSASPSPTSGIVYVMAIQLAAGMVVNNLTFVCKSTAVNGLAHGWYVLADSNRIVRAVTADQTSGSWMGAQNTPYTLGTNSYTVPTTNYYYAGIMANAGTTPTWAVAGLIASGLGTMVPLLCATSSTAQTTAPVTGSTLASLTSAANYTMYACTT